MTKKLGWLMSQSTSPNPKLQQLFGFEHFRPGQQAVVEHLLAGHSALAIFPTGSGKSLCYQYVATQLPHLTIVVSPLLALMKDQLSFLHSKGIAAASIDSTLSPDQNREVMQTIRSGQCKILMVSVERFKNERFRHFIQSVPLSMLVIDEAHCISEWGHNFRPDYLKLPSYQQDLKIPLVLLLTATATKKVKHDMAQRFAITPSHIVQTGFYRANLNLDVLPTATPDKDQQLLQVLQQQSSANPPSSGIVYVTLQKTAEQVANLLQGQGIAAKAYHAGLNDELRQRIQQDFMQGTVHVVVATIAFGMGIDKADIRFVIHYDLPKSIENYSQEIGRAGRDGQVAQCTVLANLDGLTTVENFVYGDTPDQAAIEGVLLHIQAAVQEDGSVKPAITSNPQWEMQINELSSLSNIRQLPLKTLLVQLELAGVIQPLYAYYAEYRLRFHEPQDKILQQFNGERQAFLTALFKHVEMKKIWGTLNFASLYTEYGASRERVITALDYLAEQGWLEVQSKSMTEVFAVDVAQLAKPRLSAKLSAYFAQNEQSEIKRIAALARFFALDNCLSYNLSRYFDDQAAPPRCGHCSVCAGRVAILPKAPQSPMPDDAALREAMQQLTELLASKQLNSPSLSTYCRFLTGMTTPQTSRLRLSQLSGFALCAHQPYALVRNKLSSLIAN
jgi:ATP-dependent DNA helicase RecQ